MAQKPPIIPLIKAVFKYKQGKTCLLKLRLKGYRVSFRPSPSQLQMGWCAWNPSAFAPATFTWQTLHKFHLSVSHPAPAFTLAETYRNLQRLISSPVLSST